MTIAYTIAGDPGEVDRILTRLADRLEQRGVRVCGAVQANTDRHYDGPCDMDLRILPDGPAIRISQDLGPLSRGCRLDPAALETAVVLVGDRLARGADILIVNKFGKHEAEGRGFRSVIAEAVASGIPVMIGVNRLNLAAFEAFTGGIAERLPAELPAHEDWALARLAEPAPAG